MVEPFLLIEEPYLMEIINFYRECLLSKKEFGLTFCGKRISARSGTSSLYSGEMVQPSSGTNASEVVGCPSVSFPWGWGFVGLKKSLFRYWRGLKCNYIREAAAQTLRQHDLQKYKKRLGTPLIKSRFFNSVYGKWLYLMMKQHEKVELIIAQNSSKNCKHVIEMPTRLKLWKPPPSEKRHCFRTKKKTRTISKSYKSFINTITEQLYFLLR